MERILVICNPHEAEFLSASIGGKVGVSIVMDEPELEAFTEKDIASFDGAVVMAGLAWRGHAPSDFYGMDVAVSLRLRWKMLAPICIVSFMPKSFFAARGEVKYNILKARGTVFRRMPVSVGFLEGAFDGIWPLSEATLAYLSNLLVDVQHIIDNLRHVLRMSSTRERIHESLQKIGTLSSLGIYSRVLELSAEVEKAHADGDETLFYKSSGELLELLGAYRHQSGLTALPEDAPRQKVILVDDNADDLQWAASALGQSFEVIPFRDAAQARHCIDEDAGNEIAAVISQKLFSIHDKYCIDIYQAEREEIVVAILVALQHMIRDRQRSASFSSSSSSSGSN